MIKYFTGREQIVASIPELIAAKEANYKARIIFCVGATTYTAPYRIIDGRLDFCINWETKPLSEALGTRTLIGGEWNNLTPHTLTSLSVSY